MFQVITEFENMNVAVKATELLACAFPMLKFQLVEVPELDLTSAIDSLDWSNITSGDNNAR